MKMEDSRINTGFLIISIVVALIVSIGVISGLTFMILRIGLLKPGDPCRSLVPEQVNPVAYQAYITCRENLGLDQPLSGQFVSVFFIGIIGFLVTWVVLTAVTYRIILKSMKIR